MKLFILRHGMTGESDTDEGRRLISKGVKEVQDVVNLRRHEMANVTRIFSSPLIRVHQTLEIAAQLLRYKDPIVESQHLQTGSRLPQIISFMEQLDFEAGDVLLSSHQSCTSILVLWITGEDVLIPNGSLLCIDVAEARQGGGRILWQESRGGSEIKRTADFVDQF